MRRPFRVVPWALGSSLHLDFSVHLYQLPPSTIPFRNFPCWPVPELDRPAYQPAKAISFEVIRSPALGSTGPCNVANAKTQRIDIFKSRINDVVFDKGSMATSGTHCSIEWDGDHCARRASVKVTDFQMNRTFASIPISLRGAASLADNALQNNGKGIEKNTTMLLYDGKGVGAPGGVREPGLLDDGADVVG
ncbi:uncharacterized protein BXZ73DRAFT_82846 [Epithele typhae]|uniref:uncharacterized protein n=1 Tax=Epithele typhae TaxID=378194 RepID=UPI00200858EF|nr:uncharacterized protein BXZ73DRAFT_82846 [Epithele typhae]KAH9911337.1 hypothetical protein BXZ73DRAFT_82846 [Epithele typhae]